MKVGTLPSAFLYSWQGNTLVERGHIDEVEREIEAYMLRTHGFGWRPTTPHSKPFYAMNWHARVSSQWLQLRLNKPLLLRLASRAIRAIAEQRTMQAWSGDLT